MIFSTIFYMIFSTLSILFVCDTIYCRYRGAVYADSGNFRRCTTLWMYALDMQQQMLEPLSPMTQSSFASFAELFAFMLNDGPLSREALISHFSVMLMVLEKAIDEVEKGLQYFSRPFVLSRNVHRSRIFSKSDVGCHVQSSSDSSDNSNNNSNNDNNNSSSIPALPGHHYMATNASEKDGTHLRRMIMVALQIIYLATKLYPNMTKVHHQRLHEVVYRLVKLDPRTSDSQSLLHLACATETMTTVGRNPVFIFPNREVVEILLKVGADTMSVDNHLNTPIHILANTRCPQTILQLLLKYGAHFDAANSEGDTFESIVNLNEKNIKYESVVNPISLKSLKCLAARTIKRHDVPLPAHLHPTFEKFIDMHSGY